nr:cation diffusion facilitator family transporter [Allostreptomyces psammosilenae]
MAGAANLGIAAAKAVGGVISGSSAMLSEAAHSVADTCTEVLLLAALRRSARPPDELHPLGHAAERYVWALLACVATFVGGAVFSVSQGVHTLLRGEELGDPLVSLLVLAAAFLLESVSLARGVRQVRREAAALRVPARRYLRRSPDTTVKAVVLEDGAALAGLLLAAGGLLGAEVTGSAVWDGVASVLIGALLAAVAFTLGRDNASLLIGRALPPAWTAAVRAELLAVEHVAAVLELVTLTRGPREVHVAAKVHFVGTASARQVERACEEAERRLRERVPAVTEVFLDPTPGRPRGPAG